jgi:hypothetical protein
LRRPEVSRWKFPFLFYRNRCYIRVVPPPHEGRFAIVTDVGGGMRWTPQCARRARLKRTAKPCGPGAATLASSSSGMIRGVTGATEPVPRGERGISVNTIAQGRPDVSARTCGDCRLRFLLQAGRGCDQHPAFLAPSSFFRGLTYRKARAPSCRENAVDRASSRVWVRGVPGRGSLAMQAFRRWPCRLPRSRVSLV